MRARGLLILSTVTALGLAAFAALAATRVVPGQTLAVHWRLDGTADGFAPARAALSVPVLLAFGLAGLCALLPRLDPRGAGAPVLPIAIGGVLALAVLTEATIAGPLFGWDIPVATTTSGVGLLLIGIGNMLPKVRPGRLVGIRTPWTQAHPDVWIATHRFGGWTFCGSGIAIAAAAILPVGAGVRQWLVVAALLVATIAPVAFSFIHAHRAR